MWSVMWRLLLCRSMTHGYLLQVSLLLLALLQHTQCSGFFELQVLEMSNPRGELSNGECCGGSHRAPLAPRCPKPCNTYFRLCLKEYQSNVTSTGSCSFGNTSGPVLGRDSFTLADPERGKLVLPFTFRWTRSFTLILQAVDYSNVSLPASSNIIEEATYSGIIDPSAEWHTLNHRGSRARLTYRVRVKCDTHYYNATCTKFCRPRNDKFGHYRCNSNGDKECIEGWKGTNCEIDKISDKTPLLCNSTRWLAEVKNLPTPTALAFFVCGTRSSEPTLAVVCRPACRPGWRGEFCDQCKPYPGCKHGYCNGSSWQCICDTNWGGILCDQDLNYCGTHEPCLNGGTCENTAPDAYRCTCPEGFSGINCEVVDNPCAPAPCHHGGTCIEAGGSFSCQCVSGWTGPTCDIDINECESAPCQNGGTCLDLEDAFSCECPSAWEGNVCQFDADECLTNPCVNALSCTNLVGDYQCRCLVGWTGRNCDQNINDCVGQCQHGATCIDLVNDYHCACQPGYTDADECLTNPCVNALSCTNLVGDYQCRCLVGWTGRNCDQNINDCVGQCQHGATCIDLVNDYHCACQPGYTGKIMNINECESAPCQNGGTCLDLEDAFSCECPSAWEGNVCQFDADECLTNPCVNALSCTNLVGDYQCRCLVGWTGRNCDQNINDCVGQCQHGATCIDLVNDYHCACQPGYTGVDNCMIVSMAGTKVSPRSICGEHGHCVSTSGAGYRCACLPGYTGKYCHENINDCKKNPCENGGTCVDKINAFQCICKEGWEGALCNINTDDCNPNPCHNNGTCTDRVADFECECRNGWKGKTCTLKDSHCDHSTCKNGGTCQDLGSTFVCRCPPDWEGTTCHISKQAACRSNPCQNGGTCVNTGDYYQCICRDGFTGNHCQEDVNDCIPQPCYNGGKCIDGVNWFLCECAKGFTGPDCKINVNECASNPCGHGGTCIDGIGEFNCKCPPGRRGPQCDLNDLSYLPLPDGCNWQNHNLENNATWQHECNTCICTNGMAKCTRIWCGLTNCRFPNSPNTVCNSNQVCVPSPSESCLTPPCLPFGECRDLESGKRVKPPVVPSPVTCWPNQAVLSNTCARLTLLLERGKLPGGTTVEGLCNDLRRILANHEAANDMENELVLLCDLKTDYNDTIEVTLSGKEGVLEGIRILGEAVSRQQTSMTALKSILEVKVETALVSEEPPSNKYLIALICFIVIGLTAAILVGILYFRQRQRNLGLSGINLSQSTDPCHRNHEDEKSNNLQNEENLRRYANPLKDDMGSMASLSAGTTSCLDIPKVSVVRPLSSIMQQHDSSNEMLEMISEADCPGSRRTMHILPGPSTDSNSLKIVGDNIKRNDGLNPAHRNSQILLYKAQNPDVRKNTAAFDDSVAHKDFNKSVININKQRTLQQQNPTSASGDVLTVLV
ncbi:protein jagged-1b [Agrilus planipennis]|uniref:Delta-like protein n=1 Tax=Agrilus planipennis TaxID=224129 RepID=A0A7F5R5G5_AGRPL|nr:protein jagged-1b [Agrilus planipennis]